MHLFETCGTALFLGLVLSACASSGPQPGSLEFINLQQRHELAQACYRSLTRNPWKKTYFRVGAETFVDERTYCEIKAQPAWAFRGR